jgi:hypothetical protein
MQKTSNVSIQVSSDLDYERLIAEVNVDDKFAVIISNESAHDFMIEIPTHSKGFISVELDEFIKAIKKAKESLLNLDE